MSERDELTLLLNQLGGELAPGMERMLPEVYDELRRRASAYLRMESGNQTLNTTALVHESYLKLSGQRGDEPWKGRAHFFAVASLVMRHLIVDNARRHLAAKRGGSEQPVSLDLARDVISPARAEELVALDEELEQLAAVNRRGAQVVQCRFFAGLSWEETAETLGVSSATVRRDWGLASAWLKRRLMKA